jgi:spoIIIJ-associated protein
MHSIDISSDTEDEAIAEGLRQLGVSRDAVSIQILVSAHDDLLPGAEPLPGVTVRIHIKEDVIVNQAKSHLKQILDLIGVKAHVEVLRRRGGTVLNILAGTDGSLIIGRNGQNLEAFQTLVNRMVVRGGRDLFPLYVDCEGYGEKRMDRLQHQAKRAVKQATREGREVALEPMSSSERKFIHQFVKEMRGVHTLSRGEGFERHIVVFPGEDSEASRSRRILKPFPGGRRQSQPEEQGTLAKQATAGHDLDDDDDEDWEDDE